MPEACDRAVAELRDDVHADEARILRAAPAQELRRPSAVGGRSMEESAALETRKAANGGAACIRRMASHTYGRAAGPRPDFAPTRAWRTRVDELAEAAAARVNDWQSWEDVKLWCGTWNVNGKLEQPHLLRKWLMSGWASDALVAESNSSAATDNPCCRGRRPRRRRRRRRPRRARRARQRARARPTTCPRSS